MRLSTLKSMFQVHRDLALILSFTLKHDIARTLDSSDANPKGLNKLRALFPCCVELDPCQGRAGEIQDSTLQNGYLDMLKLEVENNTQDVR